jgi:hypothetical protein
MASLHQRNRIVVFRLSQEEYNSLRSACVAAGGRNLSDFTRSELLTVVQTDGRGSALERKVVEIDRKLSDLHNLIQRVSERIGSPAPSLAGDNNR